MWATPCTRTSPWPRMLVSIMPGRKYGIAQNRPAYELLREVTHWTDAAVEYEKKVRERDVKPDR